MKKSKSLSLRIPPLRQHTSRLKKPLVGLLIFFVVVLFTSTITFLVYKHEHKNDKYEIGTSFSAQYADQLGLDPKITFTALLEQLHIKQFRLMSYWDIAEQSKGTYDFSQLDWQMEQAKSHGANVSLAIGMRQPRYPECHVPDWYNDLSPADKDSALLGYLKVVVDRYKDNPALRDYQLENEVANSSFGQCGKFNRKLLAQELKVVKQADLNHPVNISVSNQYGIPIRPPIGDEVGLSVYHRVFDSTYSHRYIEYPIPASWHGLRAALIEAIWHKPVFIHELQAEPWGPKATQELSLAEQNKSMNAKILLKRVEYAKHSGLHRMDLWGSEWWYWRMTKFNDPSLWNTAQKIYAEPNK